ncbi:MAG: hypothetical protein NDP13_03020 [Crenarchaeota archaeon]|nr:hypothetical protein [Thermoproteota archaeon]MCR8455235.1 hypothetical protein [Thermoproteota archaeon]MCR8500854.1 hypothetical protein [Thermoproteota archaeon]
MHQKYHCRCFHAFFYVRRKYFRVLEHGDKKAEIRIGKRWVDLARKIMSGEYQPVAVFKSGRKTAVYKIERIEIYPTLRRALKNMRWKELGLKASTYKQALEEVQELYKCSKRKLYNEPAVVFWLKK